MRKEVRLLSHASHRIPPSEPLPLYVEPIPTRKPLTLKGKIRNVRNNTLFTGTASIGFGLVIWFGVEKDSDLALTIGIAELTITLPLTALGVSVWYSTTAPLKNRQK